MIINSLLDNDLYKCSIAFAVLKTCERLGIHMPTVLYKFRCRNKANLVPLIPEIQKEVEHFKKLKFKVDDAKHLSGLNIFDHNFILTLMSTSLQPVHVQVYQREGELHIDIEGPWFPAILFEVPILAIVNELYFKHKENTVGMSRLMDIGRIFTGTTLKFADFGTRRRFSRTWQETAIKTMKRMGNLSGTSNMMFAKKYDLPCIGTQAHEWFQGFQVLSRDLRNFQKDALEHWLLTFRGKLSTALSDILGIDAFLKDWDAFFMHNYTAIRHDSGDPVQFINKIYDHYKYHSDSKFPTLVFSDGLDARAANEIAIHCAGKGIKPALCIGTNFTNNCGHEPLQIVIKLVKVNGSPTVKLSDSEGKIMCEDEEFIKHIKTTFNMKGKK